MENQVPMSQAPTPQSEQQGQVPPAPPSFDVEAMKAQARELAIQQMLASKAVAPAPSNQTPLEPKIIYLRRNLTVAELIVVFAIACGIVWGIPNLWQFAANRLPQIEVKVK